MKVYEVLVRASHALNGKNCILEVQEQMEEKIASIMEKAPHGSGFDCGTEFIVEKSGRNRLVFVTEFHHMNDTGYYDGWTAHTVTIEPDLMTGINIRVSGKNKNDTKDYIGEVFGCWLAREVDWVTGVMKD